MACLVNGEYNAMSAWRDDVYDDTGDGSIKIGAFRSIATIFSSIRSIKPVYNLQQETMYCLDRLCAGKRSRNIDKTCIHTAAGSIYPYRATVNYHVCVTVA